MAPLDTAAAAGCVGWRDGAEFIPPLTTDGDQLVPPAAAGDGVSILAAGVGWRDTEFIPPPAPSDGVGGAW